MTSSARKGNPKVDIAVAGHDPLRLVGLRTILESEPEFAIYPVDTSSLVHQLRSDIVLLGTHGAAVYDVIAVIRSIRPAAKIILIGPAPGDENLLRAIAAGVKGYIDEVAPAEEYKRAIRIVLGGSMWAPRHVLSKFIERVTANPTKSALKDLAVLSERERQVLELLVAGRTNKEIGAELGIEERTVKAHLSKLMHKAGVDNRIALSVHALKHSLLGGT